MASSRPDSPFDTLEATFRLGCAGPKPWSIDGRGVPGLANRMIPLDELRGMLLHPSTSYQTRDAALSVLASAARAEGGTAMVGLVGVLLFGLRRAVSGDLQLVLPQSWGHSPALRWRWRDTSRWKIEDKLGDVLDGIEARIDVDEQRRLEAERRAILRQEAEERALQQARVRWVEDQRAAVLVKQVESWARATQIRAWISAVEVTRPAPDPALEDWLAWANAYAERLDMTGEVSGFPDIPVPQAADLHPYLDRRYLGTRPSWRSPA